MRNGCFPASRCADVGLETVPWTKQWLREIGNIELK